MPFLTESDIYSVLGEDGFARLVRAFYSRVPNDNILGPMYARSLEARGDTMDEAERRLRDFLVGRFGGPQRYIQEYGHPRLRQRHGRFVIDSGAAERWIAVMEESMTEANIDPDVAAILRPFFQSTAMFMVNRQS
jgi:hemoglobin